MDAFERKALSSFDRTSLARICYLRIREFSSEQARGGKQRRAEVINTLMEDLERTAIVMKAQGQSSFTFSHTETYYWVQMASLALAALQERNFAADGRATEEAKAEKRDEDRVLPFSSFLMLFPELQPASEPWRSHWSEKLFTSVAAKRNFVMPDKEQLANILQTREIDPSLLKKAWRISARPTPAALQSAASTVVESMLPDQLGDDVFLAAIHTGDMQTLSHLDLIRMMYLHVTAGWNRGDRGTVAVSRIFDELETFWAARREKNGIILEVTAATVNERACEDLSKESVVESCLSDRFSSSMTGMTHIHFWIQMVVASITKAIHSSPKCLLSFATFITAHPELLWDGLWSLYYSGPGLFNREAFALVLPPDIAQLPAHLPTKRTNE